MARTLIDVWREGGDAWLAVVFHPRNRVTGSARTLLFTDAPSLYTEPGGTPSNARFLPRLMPSWRMRRALAASGNLTGPSAIESASFEIENSDGSLTLLKSLIWSDQPFEVYLGSPRGPAGESIGFTSFLRIFSGVTKECRGTSALSIAAVGRKSSLDNPLVQDYYRGSGMGVLLPADGSSGLVGVPSAAHNVTGALTIEWVGRLMPVRLGSGAIPLYQVSSFYGLVLHKATGSLGFVTGASESDSSSILYCDYSPPPEVDLYLAGVVKPDGVSVTLYAREWVSTPSRGFRPGTLEEVGQLEMPVPLNKTNPALGTPYVGRRGANTAAMHVYEIRVRAQALTYDELLSSSERSLPAGGSGVANLIDAWRFGEGEGSTALSEIDEVDLTLSGSASWEPSLDGDDPAVFATSLSGQTKPTCWGPCVHFPLVLLDTQTKTYGWRGADLETNSSPSSDIWGVLRANGAPLVPDETISLGAGSISFGFDDPNVIALSGTDAVTGLTMTAKRLIPGQVEPARDGQRIVVSGSVSNDGTYTLAADGLGGQPTISADGLNIRVVESMASETVVSPTPVVIRTLEADRQYTYDLATSTAVVLASDQTGTLGIDVSGGADPSYTASALAAIVADSAIDTGDMIWDPLLAVGHILNSAETRKSKLDAIALSAMCWWVEDEDGNFRLITIRPPVGSPQRRFRAEIVSIRSIASTDPFSRITVGYSQNYTVLDDGVIPSSVPPVVRARLTNSHLLSTRSASSTTLRNFPQSKPRTEPFRTHLIDGASGERWLDYAATMFLEERLWWEVTLAGAWVAAEVRAGGEYEFVYDPPTGLFETGASARVMSVSVDKASDRTILEVLT